MRVISGTAKGLKLMAPEGLDTRPTTDRVKESMFNIIQPWLPCKNVLDLFGGSGALGIEALSRGSEFCVFVENNKNAAKVIKQNIEKARLFEKSHLELNDVFLYLSACKKSFDVIFLDPPYNKGFLNNVFAFIFEKKLLSQNGIVVVEREIDGEEVEEDNFCCIKHAKYGKTTVSIYKYK